MASTAGTASKGKNGARGDQTAVKGTTTTTNMTSEASCCQNQPEGKKVPATGGGNEVTSFSDSDSTTNENTAYLHEPQHGNNKNLHLKHWKIHPSLSFTGDIGRSGCGERNAQTPNASGMKLTCCSCSPVTCQIGDGNGCNCEYGCPCGCAYGIDPMIRWSIT
ncbi:hypothetical protein M408DRAFT_326818 [Serendipita vermifera MAFF 305830]|uniref:Uncharacterized protein n=1 Tax=Serendipita vermifera MAFF 305830 TaxID=933852 RepID=A0A0C2X1N2_SERVB|nr:hypothetical protein M408DRAFT_326818 [Serendipita vermifera MAFF 305830]